MKKKIVYIVASGIFAIGMVSMMPESSNGQTTKGVTTKPTTQEHIKNRIRLSIHAQKQIIEILVTVVDEKTADGAIDQIKSIMKESVEDLREMEKSFGKELEMSSEEEMAIVGPNVEKEVEDTKNAMDKEIKRLYGLKESIGDKILGAMIFGWI